MKDLTHSRLIELLHYNPLTGEFIWKVNRSRGIKTGDAAGTLHKISGYRRLTIDGIKYREHRVVWFYMTGEWPCMDIDHKDTNTANNSWDNLRLATVSQNNANYRTPKTNTSGAKGVIYVPHVNPTKPFFAQINKNGIRYNLGYHKTLEAAKCAYDDKSKELFGEFSRS